MYFYQHIKFHSNFQTTNYDAGAYPQNIANLEFSDSLFCLFVYVFTLSGSCYEIFLEKG